MKITTKDGMVFEGTQAEYEAFLAFARKELAEQEAEYVPQEGDIVVVISNKCGSRNSVGDIGKITKVKSYGIDVEVPSKPSVSSIYGNGHAKAEVRKATPAEVEAYEKALHKASFSVGDYVKVVKSEFGNEGKILKITDDREGLRTRRASDEVINADFAAESLDGNIYGILAEKIVKATEQEVENALEAAKWAKIGRKVNEAKVGDIVQVTRDVSAKPVGTLFKVADVHYGISNINDENEKFYTLGVNVKLIAPVESTFK